MTAWVVPFPGDDPETLRDRIESLLQCSDEHPTGIVVAWLERDDNGSIVRCWANPEPKDDE